MCDKCIKRAIGRELLDIQFKLEKTFKKLDEDKSLKNDASFVALADCMADLLKKYESMR